MSKSWILTASLALNSLFLPYAAFAVDTSSTTNSSATAPIDMPKDTWINAMEPMLPGMICKGFLNDEELRKRFEDLKISYEQCEAMIPESMKLCKDKIYPSIPDKVNSETAGIWGKNLGECIGKDFAEKHLLSQN